MEGWNLDEQKLKTEFEKLHPDWNKQRVCLCCGEKFWSGKPRSVCLQCAMRQGLLELVNPTATDKQPWWEKLLTTKIIRLMAVPFILGAGYVTDALPLAIGVSVFITILALTSKE